MERRGDVAAGDDAVDANDGCCDEVLPEVPAEVLPEVVDDEPEVVAALGDAVSVLAGLGCVEPPWLAWPVGDETADDEVCVADAPSRSGDD